MLAEIQLEKILAALGAQKPDVAVIDSIQTVYSEALQSAPGSIGRQRAPCPADSTRRLWGAARNCTSRSAASVTASRPAEAPAVLT